MEAGQQSLPAAGGQPPAPRQARPGSRHDGPAATPAPAVGARRQNRQHPLGAGDHPAQLDLPRASAAGFCCALSSRPRSHPEAQQIAFYRSRHDPQITRPLIATAESQAAQTIRDNFIQPAVNAFNYRLDRFTLRWAARLPATPGADARRCCAGSRTAEVKPANALRRPAFTWG